MTMPVSMSFEQAAHAIRVGFEELRSHLPVELVDGLHEEDFGLRGLAFDGTRLRTLRNSRTVLRFVTPGWDEVEVGLRLSDGRVSVGRYQRGEEVLLPMTMEEAEAARNGIKFLVE
jgi:hypothetical protein